MVDAMNGCVGSFEECVIPILSPAEAESCQLRSDQNSEYAEWASTCKPRGDPLTLMVVAPSAASLGMTLAFTVMFFYRTAKRIRVRAAPEVNWNNLSDLQLKAILRVLDEPDIGTTKELIDRVSRCVGSSNTPEDRCVAPAVADDSASDDAPDSAPDTVPPDDIVDHKVRGHLEDKTKLAIAYEELEKMKLQDTAFETLVFILAIALFAYRIQPMLMQKEGVGCGACTDLDAER